MRHFTQNRHRGGWRVHPQIKRKDMMTIFRQFTFDSAHFLPYVAEDHKCRQMHGHTYKLTIYMTAEPDEQLGWVMDFADVKKVMTPILDIVDHKTLNNVPGLENPTCELLAKWLWDKIKQEIPILSKIELYETPKSGVVYEG
jgi:6-pyruvoyltetrahydropterin/6-carboxytetrahydropterin synthase